MDRIVLRKIRTVGLGQPAPRSHPKRFAGRRAARALALGLLGLALSTAFATAKAERRLALVIGNAQYAHAPLLRNPTQDAARVSSMLRQLDFDVTTVTNADKIAMERAIRQFEGSVQGADVALFYYSGHAIQVADRNYLVPTSAAIAGPRDLNLDTFALQDVSAAMRESGAKIQLLFLDACRDNPFGEALGAKPGYALTRGLSRIVTPTGSLVAYSTSPGQVALDGAGDLSPFTGAFAHHGIEPKLEIRQVLSRVRAEVSQVTGERQVPWDDSSLDRDFYLVPRKAPPVFDHHMRVVLKAGSREEPLRLAAPVQIEGGDVVVTVAQVPANGQLKLGSGVIKAGDKLKPQEFAALRYAGSTAEPVDAFAFQVDDAWGNSDTGTVAISHAPVASTTAEIPPVTASAAVAADFHMAAVSLVGLGPNLVFKAPPAAMAGVERIQLASNLPFGQMMLGDRVIEEGRMLDAADVRQLTYVPPSGTAGQHVEALFRPVEQPSVAIRVGIDVEMTDCDRLAGDRLDPQAVGEGVLTGQIDTAAALAACETAVKARPTLGRFVYQLGRVYAALARNDDALAQYRKAAALGHVRALWAIGNRDEYSQPPDFVQGKAMLEKAMAGGDVYATHSLGLVYLEGRGVPKDVDKARGYFEAAARVGHTFSMNSLGQMYQEGTGEPADPAMARRYWDESAKRGDMYGINNLGIAYLNGVGVDADPGKALDFFKQASDLGHPEAPNNIGRLYVLGLGVPVDLAEARKWDQIGADRGDAWASFNLGELHRLGRGGPADTAKAAYYYARAAASTNRLDAAKGAREQIAALDGRTKLAGLRLLLADLPGSSAATKDSNLASVARAAVARKHIKPSDASLDTLLVAAAQAVWVERNARSDLF